MESIKKIEIKKGLNLMMIPSDNFKTNIVSIYIQRPLSRDEVTMNSLLPSVLKCGTSKYKTPKELTMKKIRSVCCLSNMGSKTCWDKHIFICFVHHLG